MPVSLATAVPNVPTMTAASVHTMRQARGKIVCTAKHCTFAATDWPSAFRHTTANQWTARGPLPAELQLTAEQEAA